MSIVATNGTAAGPAAVPCGPSFKARWPLEYPESDGKSLSDNTAQMRWIALLYGNFEAMFRDRPDVFVAGDLMWYAVEGEPDQHTAPDAMLVFGRPKGYRGSYKQWEEGDVPATVAFEILSPKNTEEEMDEKRLWYEDHGVEEYYVYDPDANKLEIYQRGRAALVRCNIADYVSRRTGIRFEMTTPEMTVYRPDGRRFLTFDELEADREATRKRADEEQKRADEEQKRADEEQKRADDGERREALLLARLARLAELARKVQDGQATADDLAEFAKLTTPDPK